ncbi:hypothetical protein DPMN_015616 [Dreissena polymorpha]|uniref:Uncharacterized protein n=1 Tax=Dreissena polymorpha TaxID=45954 RepID=A0A9D4S6B8_DREPO|nr:hypothetical protein DPMN_015616 [Dreissena polymorpha]
MLYNFQAQNIIGTNLLTKFHEDRTVNMASRVLTRFYYSHIRKNVPPLGSNVFQANIIMFKLIQNIIETKFLTKFHDDRKINVTSKVLTRKNAPPPWWPYIIGMNLLTEFHEDRTINVASRVLTRFYYSHIYSHIKKNVPPLGSNVFQAKVTIFKLIQDIIGTNLLTKFHEDRKINVESRVLTRKNAPPLMNLLTKFHEDWTINVATRVKNATPLGHVFQAKVTIFELIQDIIGTNLLSKFHEDQKINVASRVLTRKNAPPAGGHVFQPTGIIFEVVQDIIETNLLIKKNAPPLGSHVFQANVTIFELIQDIIETNFLTKFHEDWTINVASRELTRQMLTPHAARRTKGDHKSSS